MKYDLNMFLLGLLDYDKIIITIILSRVEITIIQVNKPLNNS